MGRSLVTSKNVSFELISIVVNGGQEVRIVGCEAEWSCRRGMDRGEGESGRWGRWVTDDVAAGVSKGARKEPEGRLKTRPPAARRPRGKFAADAAKGARRG